MADVINEKKFITAEYQEIGKEKLFIASTDAEDRQGEILSIDGWDLKNFKKNPVLLWAHSYNEPPVGTAKGIAVREIDGKKKLVFTPVFHEITDRAKEIAKMVEEGIIRTVSVGFLPTERDGNTYTKQELLEISFVPVPANPEALSLALSKGISDATIKEVFVDPEKEDLKKEISEIKDMLGSLVSEKESITARSVEVPENKGRSDAALHTVRRNAQIATKALELVLRELKNIQKGEK